MGILGKLLDRIGGRRPAPTATEQARDEICKQLAEAEQSLSRGDLPGTLQFCVNAEAHLASVSNLPVTVESQRLIGDANFDLGSFYRDLGKLEKAESAYHRALSAFSELAAESPPSVEFQERMAACFNHLGNLQGDRGELARAEAAYQSALAIRSNLQGTGFSTSEGERQNGVYLGGVLCNLGHIAARQGNITSALEYYDRANTTLLHSIPPCDCGCQLGIVHAISAATGRPHWIGLGHQFLEKVARGRAELASPRNRDETGEQPT